MTQRLIPFVTTTLRIIWLPESLAPASLLAYWTGTGPAATPTYRLTPAVYARLHHAAESRVSHPETAPDAAGTLINAVASVYAALVTVYGPAEVHPLTRATPPLPALPPKGAGEDGTGACDFDRGIVSVVGAWSIGRTKGPNPLGPKDDEPVPALPAPPGKGAGGGMRRATAAGGGEGGSLW
jgi:hypothetical protein